MRIFLLFFGIFIMGYTKPVSSQNKAIAEIISSLNLSESKQESDTIKGWSKEQHIIVLIDNMNRTDWYREELPATVTLLPARNRNEAILLAKQHFDKISAVVGFCNSEILQLANKINWIHVAFSGVERCVSIPEVINGDYIVTNMRGLSAPQIAEHTIGMILYFSRGLDAYTHAKSIGIWANKRVYNPQKLVSIRQKTLLIVGLGSIGIKIANLANNLGMKIIATRNTNNEGPKFIEYIGLSNELKKLIPKADFIVNALPLTNKTKYLFDKSHFKLMKSSAYFFNVGRGKTVVTNDLIEALTNGDISGAGLDVHDPEPIPQNHHLWKTPNLLITPHIASRGDIERKNFWLILRENIRRYAKGEKMLSVISIEKGY